MGTFIENGGATTDIATALMAFSNGPTLAEQYAARALQPSQPAQTTESSQPTTDYASMASTILGEEVIPVEGYSYRLTRSSQPYDSIIGPMPTQPSQEPRLISRTSNYLTVREEAENLTPAQRQAIIDDTTYSNGVLRAEVMALKSRENRAKAQSQAIAEALHLDPDKRENASFLQTLGVWASRESIHVTSAQNLVTLAERAREATDRTLDRNDFVEMRSLATDLYVHERPQSWNGRSDRARGRVRQALIQGQFNLEEKIARLQPQPEATQPSQERRETSAPEVNLATPEGVARLRQNGYDLTTTFTGEVGKYLVTATKSDNDVTLVHRFFITTSSF